MTFSGLQAKREWLSRGVPKGLTDLVVERTPVMARGASMIMDFAQSLFIGSVSGDWCRTFILA